jgi:hypothetical protein
MKTLQEQYNKIKEGKGNKEIFLKESKRQFPNIIRNAAGFDEASNALISRSIISAPQLHLTESVIGADFFKTFNTNMSRLNEEAKAVEKKVSKEVEDVQKDKGFDYEDTKNIDNVFGQSFLNGYYAEMKDPKNEDKTVEELKDIVAKNLAKDRLHYTKDGMFGVKGLGYTESPTSKSDKMEKVKIKENIMAKLERIIAEGFQFPGVVENEETPKPKKAKKAKKETTESKMKAIEAQGVLNTLEAKICALDEIIDSKQNRLGMIDEDENMSELVDKKKQKEMQREVKILEKQRDKLVKVYEKKSGGRYTKKEMVDEESNGNSNLNSDEGSNSNSNTNPESYSGLNRYKRG